MADISENIHTGLDKRPGVLTMGISIAQGIFGISAAILAIIGIVGAFPMVFGPLAAIVVGAALLFGAGALAGRQATYAETGHAWVWLGTEFLAGTTGIALGILSLLHLVPMVLIPIAAMMLGLALTLEGVVNMGLNALEINKSGVVGVNLETVRETGPLTVGIQAFVGLTAGVLGLIALLGVYPLALSLVAILGIGAANLLNGTASSFVLNILRGERTD